MVGLISIVVPVFRVEQYLDKCIKSIVNQTYRNLEIILVDDGSDDRCPSMCDEWEAMDNRIIVIHKGNGGLSSARNAGLEIVNGEYVLFIDSDDYIELNAIEKLYNLMMEKQVDIIAFGYRKVNERYEVLASTKFYSGFIELQLEKDKLEYIYSMLLQYRNGWEAWNRLYKVNLIKEYKLQFEANKEIFAEDLCFNLYYFLCCKNVLCTNLHLYNYLIRSNSIMGQQKEIKINEFVELSKKVLELMNKNDMKYCKKNYKYFFIALFSMVLSQIDCNDYNYYARRIIDRRHCLHSFSRARDVITCIKIWGIKSGIREFVKIRKFILVLVKEKKSLINKKLYDA